ncbi:MAG: isopentenyl-diphosphate Delta-isomerase [Arcticibacter sp.]
MFLNDDFPLDNNVAQVILVDDNDRPVGSCEKLEAHQRGLLHRAFSIFIINNKGEMLLQKRAAEKYHSPALWSNACCSHPAPGQNTLAAARIRLQLEMGFSCDLTSIGHLLYKHAFDNGLTEHEYDHLLLGYYSGDVAPNTIEASDFSWVTLEYLEREFERNGQNYTYWFKMAFPEMKAHIVR